MPFVTQYRPAVTQILMQKWHLIHQQPLLRGIFKDPPIFSYKRGRPLKDIIVDGSCAGLSPHCYHSPLCITIGVFPAVACTAHWCRETLEPTPPDCQPSIVIYWLILQQFVISLSLFFFYLFHQL